MHVANEHSGARRQVPHNAWERREVPWALCPAHHDTAPLCVETTTAECMLRMLARSLACPPPPHWCSAWDEVVPTPAGPQSTLQARAQAGTWVMCTAHLVPTGSGQAAV